MNKVFRVVIILIFGAFLIVGIGYWQYKDVKTLNVETTTKHVEKQQSTTDTLETRNQNQKPTEALNEPVDTPISTETNTTDSNIEMKNVDSITKKESADYFRGLSQKDITSKQKAADEYVENVLKPWHKELSKQIKVTKEEIERSQKAYIAKFVKRLNAMSLEEQRAYFKKKETDFYNYPSRKRMEIYEPGYRDREWNKRLQWHIDAGYTLPDGVDFK
ncbi:MAG: hypothetical protein OXU23_06145 [Candidatus Poribacteria bacterium]|nr:hypothetical protein [Candidatus Poribacteria bacterium]MDE0313954.1 hypothetical protein [Candidatus Poribacteria bacterium]